MKITADFSHWTCVTESLLENSFSILEEAIRRTKHLHARVGFTEGPQVPDPRLVDWQEYVDFFMNLWKQIIDRQKLQKADFFTITPEFGPPPYMWTRTDNNEPIASQWEINVYMMNLIKNKFKCDLV